MTESISLKPDWLIHLPQGADAMYVAAAIERWLPRAGWRQAIDTARQCGFQVDVDYLRQRWQLAKRDHPIARRSDPETSWMASESITRRGTRAAHVALIVAAVCSEPGKTSAELGEIVHLDRVEAARRTSDAMADGLIEQGPKRTCTVCHSTCVTWWPVPRRKAA